jgi:hypothetical protein
LSHAFDGPHELGSIDVMRLDQSLGRSRHVACASSCIPVKQWENSRGKLPKQNSKFYASGKSKHQYLYRSLTRLRDPKPMLSLTANSPSWSDTSDAPFLGAKELCGLSTAAAVLSQRADTVRQSRLS